MSAANGGTNGEARYSMRDVLLASRMVANAYLRFDRRGSHNVISGPGGMRDLFADCRLPARPTVQTYQDLYDRSPFAARVVEIYPNACWQVPPLVYEDERADVTTPFEAAWQALGRSLTPERSWHAQQDAGGRVFARLREADVRAGVGSYGGLLLGLDDVTGADVMAAPVVPAGGRRLLYLRPLSETELAVTKRDLTPGSPRFGQPLEYSVAAMRPGEAGGAGGAGDAGGTLAVHWTRVLLVPGDPSGLPRCQQVLNDLAALQYILAGHAEGFWQACIPTKVLSSGLGEAGDVDVDTDALRDMMEQIRDGTKRDILLKQLTASLLAPTVPDPEKHVAAHVAAICAELEVPVRIFLGSERGDLASSQDALSWEARVKGRRDTHTTPTLLVPFIDRLIWAGVLPEPASEYYAGWWDAENATAAERAALLAQRTPALVAYAASPEARELVPVRQWLTQEYGYTDEEADAALAAMEADEVEGVGEDAGDVAAVANAFCPGGDLNSCPPRPGVSGKSHPYTVAEVEQMSRRERRQLARLMGLNVAGRPDRHVRAELIGRSRERAAAKEKAEETKGGTQQAVEEVPPAEQTPAAPEVTTP